MPFSIPLRNITMDAYILKKDTELNGEELTFLQLKLKRGEWKKPGTDRKDKISISNT